MRKRLLSPPRSHFFLFGPRGGLLPVVVEAPDPIDHIRSYVTTYLREEVQFEGLVRDLGGVSRFLEVVSFSHGSLLNVSKIAREVAKSRKTVEGYLSLLHDLLLSFEIPIFERRAQRAVVQHPKFYLFDAGIFNSLRPRGILDKSEEIPGAALEGLVAQHLRAWSAYSLEPHTVTFWRTQSGLEVDFIVYGPNLFAAIEVKHARRVDRSDLKGLHAFGKEYPEAQRFCLYRGDETLTVEGVRCLPVEVFLKTLVPSRYEWGGVTRG